MLIKMQNKPFNFAYLFLIFTSFIACKSQEDYDCSASDGKLIERIVETDSEGRQSIEKFVYNAQNQLDSIVGEATNKYFYAFSYNAKKQLIERVLFTNYTSKPEKARIDSFEYDAQNRLIKIKHLSNNDGKGLTFSNINVYIYDAQNKIEKEISVLNQDTFNTTIYEWENDNVVKTTQFDENKIKLWSFFYKYDNKNNPFLNTPYTYERVESRNNVVEFAAQDFSGLLDLIANPGTRKYRYNSSNFPTIETNNLSYKRTICYK
jgi:hypothetical protein